MYADEFLTPWFERRRGEARVLPLKEPSGHREPNLQLLLQVTAETAGESAL
jgi:hypothetical protein